jgi:hypothetical protein
MWCIWYSFFSNMGSFRKHVMVQNLRFCRLRLVIRYCRTDEYTYVSSNYINLHRFLPSGGIRFFRKVIVGNSVHIVISIPTWITGDFLDLSVWEYIIETWWYIRYSTDSQERFFAADGKLEMSFTRSHSVGWTPSITLWIRQNSTFYWSNLCRLVCLKKSPIRGSVRRFHYLPCTWRPIRNSTYLASQQSWFLCLCHTLSVRTSTLSTDDGTTASRYERSTVHPITSITIIPYGDESPSDSLPEGGRFLDNNTSSKETKANSVTNLITPLKRFPDTTSDRSQISTWAQYFLTDQPSTILLPHRHSCG